MNADDQLALIEQQYDAPLLNRLISIAGVSQGKENEFTRIIHHWAGLNYACYLELRHHPSFKGIQDELKCIRKISSNLIGYVDRYYTEYELWVAAADGESITVGFDRVQAAWRHIYQMQEWAVEAINNVNRKKLGRQSTSRRRRSRQLAVMELGHIWKLFTGARPTRRVENSAQTEHPRSYGPFHEFVHEALLPIFGPNGMAGIDRDIRDTCRVMDNNPDQKPPSYIHMREPSLKD
jgi:hypothetical protein